MNDTNSNRLLIRKATLCKNLGTTPSGLGRLQLRYSDFPRPIKFGESRQSPVFFDQAEVSEWLSRRKAENGKAA